MFVSTGGSTSVKHPGGKGPLGHTGSWMSIHFDVLLSGCAQRQWEGWSGLLWQHTQELAANVVLCCAPVSGQALPIRINGLGVEASF